MARLPAWRWFQASHFRVDRDIKVLVFSLFLWEIGLTLYDALLPVHLRHLGAEPSQIGIVFSFAYLIMALSGIPGGWLADRFDRKKVMLFFWALGTPSVLFLAYARSWEAALPGVWLYFLSFMTFPAINAYLTDASEQANLSKSFALLYAVFPAAQLIGPGLGGFIAEKVGMQSLFLTSFGCYLVSTLVLMLLKPQRAIVTDFQPIQIFCVFREKKFLTFSLLSAMIYLFFTALLRFTSPFLEEIRGLSLFAIGALNSIAAIGGSLLTPLAGFLGDRVNRITILAGTTLIYAFSLLIIGRFSSLGFLAGAFLIQGAFIAGRSLMDSVVANLGKGGASGLYFGAFMLITGAGQSFAPLLGAWLYNTSPQGAFYWVSGLGFLLVLVTNLLRRQYAT